jgi:hypothetical protein
VLGRQADLAQGKLIDYCAKWQEHHRAYALRYYAEHLEEAEQWEELYKLARREDFASTQRQKLAKEPDLPLETVQIALQGAAKTDNAGGMAEFLLVHAGRVMQIAQESPLDILRLGSITGALALAEKFDPERCILWYLLLAWKLAMDANQDKEKMEQAREILERLQQKDLPRLSTSWMKDCAVYLLTHLLAATEGTFAELSKRILDDESLAKLCQNLVEGRDFTAALKTARQIDDSYHRAEALIEIAKAQAQAENFTAAIETARQIDRSDYWAEALIEIAKAQAQAENFTAAFETAQQIDHSKYRAQALIEIAKAQAQAENFTAAIETAQHIDYSYDRAQALFEIAKAQVEAKLSEQALLNAEKIIIDRNEHLPEIAAAFVETDDKENFKQLLIPCAYYLDVAYKMCGYLATLYPTQATDIAKVVQDFTVSPT